MDDRVLKQSFTVNYNYDVYFTKGLFNIDNPIFQSVIKKQAGGPAKFIVIMDERIELSNPTLTQDIINYANAHKSVLTLCDKPMKVPGGEAIKNDPGLIDLMYQKVNNTGICRHSYIVAIGGGALLDAVGFAAATAHRGIRLIRVPTTVLSQDDSSVGVKNGINYFGKKNYIGTFAPPFAVLNDINFLMSLERRDWLSGLAEAVKVSLIKDASFFNYIYTHADQLREEKDMDIMQEIICGSAALHLKHIGTSGDPFELGSSRPLDFGHWAAHKLEQSTHHRLRHGESVAIGVALDSTYSYLTGLLPEADWRKIIETLEKLDLAYYVPELLDQIDNPEHPDSIFKGLTEFREHLGGQLTIMMLEKIGKGIEIHTVDFNMYREAVQILSKLSDNKKPHQRKE
jgi:3-dehydroquinate synthase